MRARGVPPELEALHYAFVDEDGEPAQSDEVSVEEIKELLASGSINAATKVWRDGMDDWIPLAECADRFGLAEALAEAGPAPEPVRLCSHFAHSASLVAHSCCSLLPEFLEQEAGGDGAAAEQSVHYSLDGEEAHDE